VQNRGQFEGFSRQMRGETDPILAVITVNRELLFSVPGDWSPHLNGAVNGTGQVIPGLGEQ